MKTMYLYFMSNKKDGVLYTGITNNLSRRVYEHKNKLLKGFTSKYNLTKLVYVEKIEGEVQAIEREKHFKKSYRREKVKLINKSNPEWLDLSGDIM